jgi:CHAD domain-containing protein
MELELQADPDEITKLSSFKPLAALRESRPRTHTMKCVWHDSPDHNLQKSGQTLAECRGTWRLEQIFPSIGTWLPAQPPPVLDEAESLDTFTAGLPSPLAPIAAFEGRRTTGVHPLADGPVTITVDRGILRSVTAERSVARVTLSGDDTAVLTAARLIAGAFHVQVPVASLAAQGIGLATGSKPTPRHLGAPALPAPDMTIPEALSHILGHLTDVILHHAPAPSEPEARDGSDNGRMEAVHQMRVAVRRALSALSIFRTALPEGTLDPIRHGLKTLGETLGHTRDWDVFVAETAPMIARAMPKDEKLERLIAAATRRRHEYRRSLSDYLNSPAFRMLGIDLAWFSAARNWYPAAEALPEDPGQPPADPINIEAFAPVVVRHRWKKLLSAGKHIEDLDLAGLHNLRLRAKRARYAAEMFASPDDGKSAHRMIRRLSRLQQSLGVLNDSAVAADLMNELGGPAGRHAYAVGLVTGFTAARADGMRPQIVEAFEKLRRNPV